MRRSSVLPLVLQASWVFGAVSAPAQPAATTAIERCWYIVDETVVPVNLPHVSVAVTAVATDRRLRRVTFRQVTKPGSIVTELVVSNERADELLDDLAIRRSECAGSPQ